MAIVSTRNQFFTSCQPQSFSLPDSVMHYITKNPSTPKVYEKLVQTCKYFYIKNPILIFSTLYCDDFGWHTTINEVQQNFDFGKISSKCWITKCFAMVRKKNKKVASRIFPEIYQSDITKLILDNYIISYDELKLLSSNVETVLFDKAIVKNVDGTVTVFEKIVELFPKVKYFGYTLRSTPNILTSTTFKELLKLPHFLKIDNFRLYDIPEKLDSDDFRIYMMINKSTDVSLYFSDEIPEAYKIRVDAILDEILRTKQHDYRIPFITFPGVREHKLKKLRVLCLKQQRF